MQFEIQFLSKVTVQGRSLYMYLFHVCFTGLHFVSCETILLWLQDFHLRSALAASFSKIPTHPLPSLFCSDIFIALPLGILFHFAVILAS